MHRMITACNLPTSQRLAPHLYTLNHTDNFFKLVCRMS